MLSDSISAADLSCADRCLRQFYSQFANIIYGNNYGECEAFILITYTVVAKNFSFILYHSILLLCVNNYILEPVASFTAWEKFIPLRYHIVFSIIQR